MSMTSNDPPPPPVLTKAIVQRALEVSLERLFRNCNKTKLSSVDFKKKAIDILYRYAYVLGIYSGKMEPENNLLGSALGALIYSLIVFWGQFYILLWVFATWFLGSLIVFLLFRLLGSSHDLLQVTNVIGYSIAPLIILEPLITLTEEPLPILSVVIQVIAVIWASRTASLTLVQANTEKKVFLFEYPLFLFNVYLLSFRTGA